MRENLRGVIKEGKNPNNNLTSIGENVLLWQQELHENG